MRLETQCNQCKLNFTFWDWSDDRIKLAMEKGKFLAIRCKNCGCEDQYHVNKLVAQPNKIQLAIAFAVLLFGTTIIAYYSYLTIAHSKNYGAYKILLNILLPSTIFGIIVANERKKRNAFNRTFVSE